MGSSSEEPDPEPRGGRRAKFSTGAFTDEERYRVRLGCHQSPPTFKDALSEVTFRGDVIDLNKIPLIDLSL